MNDKVKGYKPKIKESKLRKQLLKESGKTFQGPDGKLYKVSAEGFARLLKKDKTKSTAREKAIKKSGTKNMPYKESSAKGGGGNYTPRNIKKMPTISREMKHGGSVKKSKKKK